MYVVSSKGVFYKAFCLHVAQDRMNGAPNEVCSKGIETEFLIFINFFSYD